MSGTTLTIPEVVLASTTDSTVANAVYTATLATASDRFVYPLLQNFFVDPEYLASSTQSSVEFASAGTAAINGIYTYRGQTGGYNYYNLQGQSTSTTLFVVKNDGSQWKVTDSVGTTMYTTVSQEDLPWDGGWTEASGSAPAPNVSENTDYISGTWEQLTLSNQGVSSIPPQWPGPFWNVPQVKEYVNSLVGDGTTPFASRTVIGKTALDENPVLSTDPVAVAINSNRILRVLVEDYANNLATAVTDIGATPTTLVIKEDATVSTAVTIPATLYLEFQQGAVLTKSLSGAIEFEGFGITDPLSQIPIFSNFATGGIQWTGTDAPVAISAELWDTASVSLTARLDRANAAFPSKTVQIVAYPRTITGTTTFSENRSLHFTVGEYPNTIATNIYPFIFTSDFTCTADLGAIINISATGGAGFKPTSLTTSIQNIFFDGLHLVGDPAATADPANSVIIIGNANAGYIRNCIFEDIKQYVVIGGAGSSGNYAENCDATGNKFINCPTQALDVINGKNCSLVNNDFDVRGITSSSNGTLIDIEPNEETDVIDGLVIRGNTFDMRSTGVLYMNAITVQSGYGGATNVTIEDNIATGEVPGNFLIGISCYGVNGLTIKRNRLKGASALPYLVYNCADVIFSDNDAHDCGDSSGNLASVQIKAVRDGQFISNTLGRGINPAGRATRILESELSLPCTSSGSTITTAYPGFMYSWWDGLTITLNGTDYVIATFVAWDEVTTTVAPGALTVKTAASATDIDTGTDTITLGAHNFIAGCALRYTAGSVAVGGLTDGTDYFVLSPSATTIQLAATVGGSVINLTATGTGTQTFTPVLKTKFSNNTYKNNDAEMVTLEPTGTSRLLGDYIRTVTDTLAFSISANTDNYAPSQNVVRYDITTDASRNLTGLVFTAPAQINGEHHTFYNAGVQNLVIVHNATSTAANRFWCNTLADITVLPGQRVDLEYNSTISRWMVAAYGVIITAASLPTGIDAAKIADGSVSNTEFQYLSTVTSNVQTQMDLKAPLANATMTGTTTVATLASTTSAIGTATGTSLATTGLIKSSSATAGIGYATGAGTAGTQGTSRTTAVTANGVTGSITLFSTAGSATPSSFTVNNTSIAATDVVIVNQKSGTDKYVILVTAVAANSFEITNYTTGGTTSEAPVFSFAIIKGVTS